MNKNTSVLLALFALVFLFGTYLYTQAPKVSTSHIQNTPTVSPTPTPPPAPVITPHTDFREIVKGDPSKKQVIITINAGRGERSADGILKAYSKRNMKGTFFLVGKWAEEHPEIVKRIAREGHEIFNHSYGHQDYRTLTAEEIKVDLQKMDDTLFRLVGVRTRPYYRAPFGYRNEAVNQAAAEAGFQHIYWSVDSIDWREGETGASIKKRVLDHIHPGAIVLLHIDDAPTGDIMDELFTEIENRGYEIVSLTEGLK